MAVANLYIVPDSPAALAEWSFANMASHRDINRVIYQRSGVNLTEFPLDPFDPKDMGAWLYHHQQMHNSQNIVLGIKGFDLTQVDWSDADNLENWIQLHAQEHVQASTVLNLG